MSHSVFGSDLNIYYDFINDCLNDLSENICVGFSDVFQSKKYLKSILNIKFKKISYELLPFNIHEHLFFCQRGIRDVNRCNFCTRFFLEHTTDMVLVKNAVHLFSYQFSHIEVNCLFQKVRTSDIFLNVFNETSDFVSHGPTDQSYGEVFIDLINNPFALHITYLEIYSRVYFNLLKDVTEFVSLNYFFSARFEDKLKSQKHCDIRRSLLNHCCLPPKKQLQFLSSCTDPNYIERIYNKYLPKIDYNSKQIEVIRKR